MKKNYSGLNATLVHQLRTKIEDLKKSEEKFKNIFEKSADGMAIADAGTKQFVEVNSAYCRLTGYSRDELLKKTIIDVHPKKDLPYVLNEFRLQAEGKKNLGENIPILRKDGNIIYTDANSVPVFINNSPSLLGIFRDMTEKRKTEEKLKESERRFDAVLQNTSDQIFMLDRKLRYLSANKAAADLSHTSIDKMIGKSIYDFNPKSTADQFSRNVKRVFTTGKSLSLNECIVIGNRKFYGSTILNPIKYANGKTIAVVGIVRDVTERKNAEEKLNLEISKLKQELKRCKLKKQVK